MRPLYLYKYSLISGGEDEVCGFPGLPVGGRLLLGEDGQPQYLHVSLHPHIHHHPRHQDYPSAHRCI